MSTPLQKREHQGGVTQIDPSISAVHAEAVSIPVEAIAVQIAEEGSHFNGYPNNNFAHGNNQPNMLSYQPPPPQPQPAFNFLAAQPNEPRAREFLSRFGWPYGLQSLLINTIRKIPIRFFICDNSGSMMSDDGHRLVGTGNGTRLVINIY